MPDIVAEFVGGSRKTEKSSARRSSTGGEGGNARSKEKVAKTEEAEAEHRFHEASCTSEASARIYACRVDSVHTDTYRILGGLNSADMGDEDDAKDGEDGNANKKKRRICGVNTLEKNETNILQQSMPKP